MPKLLRFLVFLLLLQPLHSCRAADFAIDPDIYKQLESRNSAMEGDLLIAHMTDIHHYAPSLYNPESTGFARFASNNEGRTVIHTAELMEALKMDMLGLGADILLLSGDMSILGARETHEDMARILQEYEAAGIRVFITTGNHDVNNPGSFRIVGDATEDVPWTTPQEFRTIYSDFGFDESVMSHDETLSYLVYLNDETALLALDTSYYQDNGFLDYAVPRGIILDSLYEWAAGALERAAADGRRVIAMGHHNLLRHYETDADLGIFMVNDDGRILEQLAGSGVEVYLSGHIHKSDTNTVDIQGRAFTGVTTTSLSLYPHSYRLLGFREDRVGITTRPLPVSPEILAESRSIAEARRFNGLTRRLEGLTEREIDAVRDYFRITNLYAQQGLEAYLPDEIRESRGGLIASTLTEGPGHFIAILSSDSPPDDWDAVIQLR